MLATVRHRHKTSARVVPSTGPIDDEVAKTSICILHQREKTQQSVGGRTRGIHAPGAPQRAIQHDRARGVVDTRHAFETGLSRRMRHERLASRLSVYSDRMRTMHRVADDSRESLDLAEHARVSRRRRARAVGWFEPAPPLPRAQAHHALANPRPCGFAPVRIGVLLQTTLQRRLGEDAYGGLRQMVGAAERNKQAAFSREYFLRVRIGCRHDGFSSAERVGKGAAGDLLRIQIRRHIDIAGEEIVDDFRLTQVLVHEIDVSFKAPLADQLPQLGAVGLASTPNQLRMGLTDDQVQRGWIAFANRRHRLDHVFEAFAWIDQTEGRDDGAISQIEALLHPGTAARLDWRYPSAGSPRPGLG